MIDYGIWQDEDDISVDSALTPRLPMRFEVSKAASREWNRMTHNTKKARKDRATELNSCPSTDGRFATVPAAVDSSATQHIIASLSLEWINFVRMIKQSIVSRKNATES